jgi:hypothetical protein
MDLSGVYATFAAVIASGVVLLFFGTIGLKNEPKEDELNL